MKTSFIVKLKHMNGLMSANFSSSFHLLPSSPCMLCFSNPQVTPHCTVFLISVPLNCCSLCLECPSPNHSISLLFTPHPCPLCPDSPWYKSPQFPSHSHSPKTNEWETRLEVRQWFSGLLILNSGFQWNLRLWRTLLGHLGHFSSSSKTHLNS